MRHRLFCLLLIVCVWLFPLRAQAAPTPDLFRLQVVAESDSDEDQVQKIRVRDAVLALADELLNGVDSSEEAEDTVKRHMELFESAAKCAVNDECTVRVAIGSFVFPDRIYGHTLVPAGEYRALKITLGRGAGHNWWCVLYPSLCVIDETAVKADGTITFYSTIWEFLKMHFGGETLYDEMGLAETTVCYDAAGDTGLDGYRVSYGCRSSCVGGGIAR